MGGFLLIHWWPHKGSVMRKVFPCHYVFIIPILCPLMSQIGCNSLPDDFSQKKIILFHSYLEMRQDGDTPDHTDSALLRILVSGSEFIHLWARRPDWEVSACMEDEKDPWVSEQIKICFKSVCTKNFPDICPKWSQIFLVSTYSY